MNEVAALFADVDDPRAGNRTFRMGDLIVLMLAATLCGATSASDMAVFADLRKPVMNRLIDYKRAPSHDTFSRALRLLKPDAFAKAFAVFAEAFARALKESGITPGPAVVALDGKALRRAYERGLAHHPPMVVSAFAAGAGLCLAAQPVNQENEIEAALKVVELLDLAGKIVTADALHCHHRMTEALVADKADYVLALKANRPDWHADAIHHFRHKTGKTSAKQLGTEHGRNEWRKAEVIAAQSPLTTGHAAYLRITSARDSAEPTTRYYIASRMFTAKQALLITREHWRIENNLHWMLDVHFAEDNARARKDNAPANIAMLKRLARNLLQTADAPKTPISHRLKKCMWDDNYLIHALSHMR